jgi:DNA-binding PadR family transcriptional regulator
VTLKQHWFHILLALARGGALGAEIRRRVREDTKGTVKLYPAMLYGSLEDLQEQGLVQEIDEQAGRPSGENVRYRYYRLTRTGRRVLLQEIGRLEQMAQFARERIEAGQTK